MSTKKTLTLDEIISILDDDENILEAKVFMGPPENPLLSDEDSEDEDFINPDINHLSGNQLCATAELLVKHLQDTGIVSTIMGEEDIPEEYLENVNTPDNENKSNKIKTITPCRKWQDIDLPLAPEPTWEQPEWLQNSYSPVEIFEMFFDIEVLELIVNCSNNYAFQKGNIKFKVTINEIKVFLGILLLSGYCSVPRYRMYWETSSDTHNEAVSKAMSRNTFEDILKYLHVYDNLTLDENAKFGKDRPTWLLLNKRWLHAFPRDANVSIDEAIVPYYGSHGAKQHIHGKPIRFGYKVWCLCNQLGYLVQGEPYQGASTGNTHPELGVGGSVVIDLVDKLPHGQYTIYIDNFFTSVRLLEELKSKGHYCTGTIRSNRIEKASLEEASTLKKKLRGSYSQLTDTDSGTTLIRYHDNNIVTVASTLRGAKPIGKARRWSHKENKRIQIDQPACIINYNCYMGGVDRFDQNISTYRVNVRMKKCYWQMIMFPLNASVNNAWQLNRLTSKGKENKLDLLGFTLFIVQTYLSTA